MAGGSRKISSSKMPRCQHAIMQDAHNFDAVVGRSVVNNMANDRIPPIATADSIASCSSLWPDCQRREGLRQIVYIAVG